MGFSCYCLFEIQAKVVKQPHVVVLLGGNLNEVSAVFERSLCVASDAINGTEGI